MYECSSESSLDEKKKPKNREQKIMGKTPKQYKRRDGDTTPEKIDVDDELERQYRHGETFYILFSGQNSNRA